MKADHEQQVSKNRQFPELMDGLKQLFQKYQPTDEPLGLSIPEMIEGSKVIIVRVDASKEGGINTGIKVQKGNESPSMFAA